MKKNLLSLIIILTLFSCEEGSNSTSNTDERKIPVEELLANLDNITDTTDIKAIRIKTLVNKLSAKYAEPKDTIAEYTSKVQGALHDQGIQESCLNILEEMNKVDKMDNTKYKDIATLYLMIRSGK